jgi:hypothetical protein
MIATKWSVTSERRVAMTMISNEKETQMVMPADWVPGPRQGDLNTFFRQIVVWYLLVQQM